MEHGGSIRSTVAELARAQGGCVARWQAEWLGMASATAGRLVDRDGYRSLHRGVLLAPGVARSSIVDHWAALLAVSRRWGADLADGLVRPGLTRVDAAARAARRLAVFTGRSGLWLEGVCDAPSSPHLLLESAHHARRDGFRTTRTTSPIERGAWRRDLPVAEPARMFWDEAWRLRRSGSTAVTAIADLATVADRLRLVSVEELIGVVDEPPA